MFDTFIVGFDSLFEIVGAIFVCKVRDYRDWLIGFHLGGDFGTIHDYLRMENLLVNTFVKIVRHCPHEHTLREVGNLACRDKAFHLCGDRGRFVITINGHGLPLLKHLTETLGKRLGCFAYYLTRENIAHRFSHELEQYGFRGAFRSTYLAPGKAQRAGTGLDEMIDNLLTHIRLKKEAGNGKD